MSAVPFDVPLYSLAPFALMLASIAVLPLIAHEFWEKNRNKLIISLVLGIPTTVWLLAHDMLLPLEHAIVFDYIPFIILLGSLFVITGGIFVDGNLEAKPTTNLTILGIGAVLASLMGTTGAAMLLIRPIIATNKERKFKVHTILFFIAIVANCGGLLTPLGDPPLFMMYLRGAPFFWFLNLLPEWLFINITLLVTYYFVDNFYWNKESYETKENEKKTKSPVKLRGYLNFLWLFGVVLSVAFLNSNTVSFIQSGHLSSFIREGVIVLMALLSLKFTAQKVRAANNFNWEPIEEVAFLFLGIFITMVPCLEYLSLHAKELGITDPVHFYYATGALSGFLDNTPTAVTFHQLAKGLTDPSMMGLVAGIPEKLLIAISASSVYFGAMTYIGNGPNFMVKAIAESSDIKMPDFFSYMVKFSLIILLPIFILAQLLFI